MGLSANPLSLRDQLAFYGAYHSNHVNVLIHIVCVPLIWMTTLALLLTRLPAWVAPAAGGRQAAWTPSAATYHRACAGAVTIVAPTVATVARTANVFFMRNLLTW